MSTQTDLYVDVEQLQVGVFVHLDLGWLDHPFALPSFKIKSADQIETIRRLGLERIRVDRRKSEAPPLPPPERRAPAERDARLDAEYQSFLEAKRQRQEQLQRQREALEGCEKKFGNAAAAVKAITQNLFARPAECVAAAGQLVEQMAQSLLTDREIALHLMGLKKTGEEMYFHSLNVSVLAMTLAKEMKLPPESISALGMGGLFHDIGKMDVPDRILLKVDPLTKAERDFYELHCDYGVEMAHRIGLPPSTTAIIAQHHEHMDGSGFPRRLQGEIIHALARIIAIVNGYDNLCNNLVPAKSLTPHEALSVMYAHRRAHFDPHALNQFVRVMGVYPPGTVVSLNNEMLGIVVSITLGKPLRPSVMLYDPTCPSDRAPIIDLDQEPELNITKSIRPAQLPREVHEYLNPRKHISYFFDASARSARKSRTP